MKITYADVTSGDNGTGEKIGRRADILLSNVDEQIKNRTPGNYSFSAVGVGINLEDAQIALHNQLQGVYEEIGKAIVFIREEIEK